MNRRTFYLVRIPGDPYGNQYVWTVDRSRKVLATTPWMDDAQRFTYNVALTVARRNGGRLKLVQQ